MKKKSSSKPTERELIREYNSHLIFFSYREQNEEVNIMTKPEHLSNKELVDEFYDNKRPSRSLEEQNRRDLLKEELLRRLNEPWMRLREDKNDKH